VRWARFTKRTDPPKLAWLINALGRLGIACRLNGDSFHAPILEVDEAWFDRAWRILTPVDDLPDGDVVFETPFREAWWPDLESPTVGALAAGAALLANKIRRSIASGAGCAAEDVVRYGCPLLTGLVEACPANLLSVCRPLNRLEVFGLALGQVLRADDEESIARCDDLVQEFEPARGKVDAFIFAITFCHVVSSWVVDDLGARLRGIRTARDLVEAAMRDMVIVGDRVSPKRAVVEIQDLIGLAGGSCRLN